MARASIGDYVVTSKLGRGSFAVVYKGYHRTSHVPVAIKALSLHKLNRKLLDNLEMEIAILRQIDHPNVVKLYEIKKTDKHMYLVLEFCAGGDLQQFVQRQEAREGRRVVSEDVARHFLYELAKGMHCLWTRNLIHRDLKPQNLLLVEDSATSALKIADFGFARHLATTSMAETLCGSPLYMAPEILKFQKYDAKADLWSVGTILFEILAGRPPYGGANHVQLLANIERQPLRFPPTLELSKPCRQLLVALLQRKPALRLGFDEFFADPFVNLQPVPGQVEAVEVAQHLSIPLTTASIREDEEEDEHRHSGRWKVSTAGDGNRIGAGGDDDKDEENAAASPEVRRGDLSEKYRRSRVATSPHEVSSSLRFASTAPSATMRQSRSGNLEVMESAFASASSGPGSLRRSSSSRLARSRRASSSGGGLSAGTSPKLSPQMSPLILPSPSPRINPFKQLSESPPGATALQQHQLSLSGLSRTTAPAILQPTSTSVIMPTKQKIVGGCGHALENSEEYVLVDGSTENSTCDGLTSRPGVLRTIVGETVNALHTVGDLAARELPSAGDKIAFAATSLRERDQQLIDIVMLRTQAITHIADQLWALSATNDTASGSGSRKSAEMVVEEWSPQQTIAGNASSLTSGGKRASGGNFSSVFSMGSSLASLDEISNALEDDEEGDDDEDDDEKRNAEHRFVCAAEALVLYVKCLRLIQNVVLYLRQDPVFVPCGALAGSSGSFGALAETSRKVSMAFLSDHLTHFLGRADKCKAQMNRARLRAPSCSVASQEELLYAHALRIGHQGAIREVLGHARAAHDYYLQALLLLESLLMDTPGASVETLTVDDQKNVNNFLHALEQRLKNARTLLENEADADATKNHHRQMQ